MFSDEFFFLYMKSNIKICLDYKVLPRESLTIQHILLLTNVRVNMIQKIRRQDWTPRIKL